ncbi:unnamed protein product, partial [Allacma fusca]
NLFRNFLPFNTQASPTYDESKLSS